MAEKGKQLAPRDPIYDLIAAHKQSILRVVPKHVTPERLMRIAHTSISGRLRECTPASLINGIIEISILGLEIGRTAYLIPFKNRGRLEAQVIIDYRGFIELAFRSGMVQSFPFKPVYSNEEFQVMEGTSRSIQHVPIRDESRGDLVAAYAICNFSNGGYDFEVVGPADVAVVKRKSMSARKGEGPWVSEDDEWTMWCKTCVRRLSKRIPQAPELQRSVMLDEAVEAGIRQKLDYVQDLINVTPGSDKAPKDLYKANGSVGEPKSKEGVGHPNEYGHPSEFPEGGVKEGEPDPPEASDSQTPRSEQSSSGEHAAEDDKTHPWHPTHWVNQRRSKHGGIGFEWWVNENKDTFATAHPTWKSRAKTKWDGLYPDKDFPIYEVEPGSYPPVCAKCGELDTGRNHVCKKDKSRSLNQNASHDSPSGPFDEPPVVGPEGELLDAAEKINLLDGYPNIMPDDADGYMVMELSGMCQKIRQEFPVLTAQIIENFGISPDDVQKMRVPSERYASAWEFIAYFQEIADSEDVDLNLVKVERGNGSFKF